MKQRVGLIGIAAMGFVMCFQFAEPAVVPNYCCQVPKCLCWCEHGFACDCAKKSTAFVEDKRP